MNGRTPINHVAGQQSETSDKERRKKIADLKKKVQRGEYLVRTQEIIDGLLASQVNV